MINVKANLLGKIAYRLRLLRKFDEFAISWRSTNGDTGPKITDTKGESHFDWEIYPSTLIPGDVEEDGTIQTVFDLSTHTLLRAVPRHFVDRRAYRWARLCATTP